jgi:hypothetical protein
MPHKLFLHVHAMDWSPVTSHYITIRYNFEARSSSPKIQAFSP